LGFGYDQAYVSAAGGKWPGLQKADTTLREAAEKNRFSVDKERQLLSRVFGRVYSRQRALEK
jgi:hypothetical protein